MISLVLMVITTTTEPTIPTPLLPPTTSQQSDDSAKKVADELEQAEREKRHKTKFYERLYRELQEAEEDASQPRTSTSQRISPANDVLKYYTQLQYNQLITEIENAKSKLF